MRFEGDPREKWPTISPPAEQEAEARRLEVDDIRAWHRNFHGDQPTGNCESCILDAALSKAEQELAEVQEVCDVREAHEVELMDALEKAEQELADNKQAVEDLKVVAGRLRDERDAAEAQVRDLREAYRRSAGSDSLIAGIAEAPHVFGDDVASRARRIRDEHDVLQATQADTQSKPLAVQPLCVCGHRYDRHDHNRGTCYECQAACMSASSACFSYRADTQREGE